MSKTVDDPVGVLKARLAEAAGKQMACASDFAFLQAYVYERTHESVGLNTLKRLWEYGNAKVSPRTYTLDLLARAIGYRNFADFKTFYADSGAVSSDLVLGKSLDSRQLATGDRVELCWNPGRICTVEYLGNNTYRVVESEATKLKPGNTFQTPFFAEGTSILLANLVQDGVAFPLYEIGKQGGLTQVRLLTL